MTTNGVQRIIYERSTYKDGYDYGDFTNIDQI